jgi:hypothetical protein
MKIHPFLMLGVLLIALGIGGLVHPNLSIHSKKDEVQIGSTKAIIETQHIVQIPAILSGVLVLFGGLLVFLGARQPWETNQRKLRK